MTTAEWIGQVKENLADIESLVANYHPGARDRHPRRLPITAPAAQDACNHICARIAVESSEDPLEGLRTAIASQDVSALESLFSQVWFGVPESRACWSIPGFSLMVELMDDPPDDFPDYIDTSEEDAQ